MRSSSRNLVEKGLGNCERVTNDALDICASTYCLGAGDRWPSSIPVNIAVSLIQTFPLLQWAPPLPSEIRCLALSILVVMVVVVYIVRAPN